MGIDYKQKYLKYKIKYLNAKKKFRGGMQKATADKVKAEEEAAAALEKAKPAEENAATAESAAEDAKKRFEQKDAEVGGMEEGGAKKTAMVELGNLKAFFTNATANAATTRQIAEEVKADAADAKKKAIMAALEEQKVIVTEEGADSMMGMRALQQLTDLENAFQTAEGEVDRARQAAKEAKAEADRTRQAANEAKEEADAQAAAQAAAADAYNPDLVPRAAAPAAPPGAGRPVASDPAKTTVATVNKNGKVTTVKLVDPNGEEAVHECTEKAA